MCQEIEWCEDTRKVAGVERCKRGRETKTKMNERAERKKERKKEMGIMCREPKTAELRARKRHFWGLHSPLS